MVKTLPETQETWVQFPGRLQSMGCEESNKTELLTLKKKNIYIYIYAAKSLQPGPTLCDSIDGTPPGSPVPGILQARTLEWVAISFSNARK